MPLHNPQPLRLSELKRIVRKYVKKGMYLYTMSSRRIVTNKCYKTITKNSTNTIVLMPNKEHIRLVRLENFTFKLGRRLVLKPKAKRNRLNENRGVNRDNNRVENGDRNKDDNRVKNGNGNRDKKGGRRDNGVKNGSGNRDKKGGRREK
jgi:hypothetical protein